MLTSVSVPTLLGRNFKPSTAFHYDRTESRCQIGEGGLEMVGIQSVSSIFLSASTLFRVVGLPRRLGIEIAVTDPAMLTISAVVL